MTTTINYISPPKAEPSEVGRAIAKIIDDAERFTASTLALAKAMRTLDAIAALADPRRYLGWTHRRWNRERRAYNAGRRRWGRVTKARLPAGFDVVAFGAAMAGAEWRLAVPASDVRPLPRAFTAYVAECIADGRLPMRLS